MIYFFPQQNPLAPYNIVIEGDNLSSTSKRLLKNQGVNPRNYRTKKMITDFSKREKYTIHCKLKREKMFFSLYNF